MKCLIVDDDALSREIIQDLVEQTPDLTLVKSCESAMEAFNVLKDESIDLVFLDVEMPEMSGIELIKNVDVLPQVILVTSHTEYALESYEYNVTDFIAKPLQPARFLKAIEKAKKMHQMEEAPASTSASTIFIKTDSRLVQVDTRNILFIEALGNYVNIYTDKGRYTILSTMKEIEKKLGPPEFARVHRSYIVRIDKIDLIEDNLIAINDKQINIGKVYKEELTKQLNML